MPFPTFSYKVFFINHTASNREFLLKKAYNDWQDNPVLTSVSTTAMPIAEIEFPAITICGQGSIAEVSFGKKLRARVRV